MKTNTQNKELESAMARICQEEIDADKAVQYASRVLDATRKHLSQNAVKMAERNLETARRRVRLVDCHETACTEAINAAHREQA